MGNRMIQTRQERLNSPVEHLCVKGRWVGGLRSLCDRGDHKVKLQRGRKDDNQD